MSEEQKKELKTLSKDLLTKQLNAAKEFIELAQKQIKKLEEEIQRNIGIAGLANHLINEFDLPEKQPESKKLEVV
jgi:hypothetical protein